MSSTLPPCTSLVLAGSSGFCGSPQEALSTAPASLLPPPSPSPPPQAVAARATTTAQATHLACVAPSRECLLVTTQSSADPLPANIGAKGARRTHAAPLRGRLQPYVRMRAASGHPRTRRNPATPRRGAGFRTAVTDGALGRVDHVLLLGEVAGRL